MPLSAARKASNRPGIGSDAASAGAAVVLPISQLLLAAAIDLAINDKEVGVYSLTAISFVAIAVLLGLAGLLACGRSGASAGQERKLRVLLVGFFGLEFILQMVNHGKYESPFKDDWYIVLPLVMLGAALLALVNRSLLRALSLPIVLDCCAMLLLHTVWIYGWQVHIDVLHFQRESAAALLQHQNPYAMRYASVYRPGTPFYGPGVVDKNNWLTYGFPYMPLSLLMVLPGHLLGDVRYAHIVALTVAGLLMWLARRRATSVMVMAAFLLSPRIYWVINYAWTDSLLIFTLSLVMFCALRWRRGLPVALGLFLATKQYTVLAVPAVWLLTTGPNRWRDYLKLLGIALAVAAAITVPFFLWNPHEFWRAVVQWQFVQPFRDDALSFLVLYAQNHGGQHLPLWTPFVAVVPVVALALWRLPRNPAGFAAALTLTYLVFFAMNKQAFCNYYFLVIGMACWSAAAWKSRD